MLLSEGSDNPVRGSADTGDLTRWLEIEGGVRVSRDRKRTILKNPLKYLRNERGLQTSLSCTSSLESGQPPGKAMCFLFEMWDLRKTSLAEILLRHALREQATLPRAESNNRTQQDGNPPLFITVSPSSVLVGLLSSAIRKLSLDSRQNIAECFPYVGLRKLNLLYSVKV